jgi:hypothetical protein
LHAATRHEIAAVSRCRNSAGLTRSREDLASFE